MTRKRLDQAEGQEGLGASVEVRAGPGLPKSS